MKPLVRYYLRQAGRSSSRGDDSGPIYFTPHFLQRGHGIGSFLGGLWRVVRSIIWRVAKTLGSETIRTRGKILTDIAENKSPDVTTRDSLETRDRIDKKIN